MQAELFREFVAEMFDGNRAKAAKALNLSRSAVSRICNGARGITPALAQRVETISGGRFPKESLVFGSDSDCKEGEAA